MRIILRFEQHRSNQLIVLVFISEQIIDDSQSYMATAAPGSNMASNIGAEDLLSAPVTPLQPVIHGSAALPGKKMISAISRLSRT